MVNAHWKSGKRHRMLELLESTGQLTWNKAQFFTIAACKLFQKDLIPEYRHALDVAADVAEGKATAAQLAQAHGVAVEAYNAMARGWNADRNTIPENFQRIRAANEAAHRTTGAQGIQGGDAYRASVAISRVWGSLSSYHKGLTGLMSEIFGPDPTDMPHIEKAWLTETVVGLVAGIRAERAFDRLPILADALEEAGCDHAGILTFCRDTKPHVSGCWIVESLYARAVELNLITPGTEVEGKVHEPAPRIE